jgi:hypothetical protein
VGLLAAALVRRRWPASAHDAPDASEAHEDRAAPVPVASVGLGALVGASVVGGLLVSWGVRPKPGLDDLWLGVLSLGSIGLACAISIAAVARMADRHLA